MRIYFPGISYSGRASLLTLKRKRHRDVAEAAYSKSDCWKWLLR